MNYLKSGRIAGTGLVLAILLGTLMGCPSPTSSSSAGTSTTTSGGTKSTGTAKWAQTLTSGSSDAYFKGVTIDSSGNTYAVGYITGTGSYGFGNSIIATGTSSNTNPVIVKYNSSGTTQWAKTIYSGSSSAQFDGVTIDSIGNLYAVGTIAGNGSYDFGNSITATGTSIYSNPVIVKYDSAGTAQWAKTITSGSSSASFNGVSIDSSGNPYAVGAICGTGSYGFGTGITAAGTSIYGNPVIVKYDSAGTAQWAKTITSGSSSASFSGVSIDSSGNSYAVGAIQGTGSCCFGPGITATGTSSTDNPVIVKYSSSGTAQWAQTITSGSKDAFFFGVTIDSSGNTYAVGSIQGTGSYSFGTGITAIGTSSSYNSVIVKYNSSGTAQWAQTITSGSSMAIFQGVTIDSSGNLYAVGGICGTGSYGFGNSVTATGTSINNNPVIVKYNSSGTAQWAQTITSGSSGAPFNGVTIDSSGNTYAVGYILGTGSYGFGSSVTATGASSGSNPVIVKYGAQ